MIDREAVWVDTAGADDDETIAVEVENDDYLLLFEYEVVTGDSAADLDYWTDDEARRRVADGC